MNRENLTPEDLNSLKQKLPKKYNPSVRKAYLKLTGKVIGERAVFRFFSGETYTEELHDAALHVAEVYQKKLEVLKKRTDDLINQ